MLPVLVAAVAFPAGATANARPAPGPVTPPPTPSASAAPVPPTPVSKLPPVSPTVAPPPSPVGSPGVTPGVPHPPLPAAPTGVRSPPQLDPLRASLPTLGHPLVQRVVIRLAELRGGAVLRGDRSPVHPVGTTIAATSRRLSSPSSLPHASVPSQRPAGGPVRITWRAAATRGLRRDTRVIASAGSWVGHLSPSPAPGRLAVAPTSGAPQASARAPAKAAQSGAGDLARLFQAADRFMMSVPTPIFAVLLALLLGMVAMFRRERRRARQAEHAALSDPLTGLPNRLALNHRLAIEWERSRRYGRPLGVIALDLDDLKHVNDRNGHAAGDRLLCDAAGILNRRSRRSDAVARLGGDEFVILVSETRGREMEAFADAIRTGLRAGGVRASVGYAELQSGDTDPTDLLGRADADMYREKRGTRHRDEVRILRPERAAALARSAKV